MRICRVAFGCILLLAMFAAHVGASEPEVVRGEVRFVPPRERADVPEPFRLPAETFAFEEKRLGELSRMVEKSIVTFPSPVKSPHERNNTVHCEFYRPIGGDKTPGVIVLHILGGDFALSRVCASALAHNGVSALFVKMPYYGPRRQPGVARQMISKNMDETIEGMTQAVLDIRYAAAWLGSREEVDADNLGVFGISLGGITGALAATSEPRLKNVCLVLAGGDLGRVLWESPELEDVRQQWIKDGRSHDDFIELAKAIDPVTYGDNVRGRRILMLNAKQDEVIPKVCTESLWNAFGRPDIVWYGGGHYSMIRNLFSVLGRMTRFFADAKSKIGEK